MLFELSNIIIVFVSNFLKIYYFQKIRHSYDNIFKNFEQPR